MTDRKKDDSLAEELSAMGQRVKGETKNAVGHMTGDSTMERSGERDIAESKKRQEDNNVLDESDGHRNS